MSETKHTSEPWELHPDYPNQVRRPPSNDAYGLSACIADCSSGIWPDAQTVANASRIVACVNACRGINPEAVPDLLDVAKDFRQELSLCMAIAGNMAEKVARLEAKVNAAIAKAGHA